MKANGVDVYLIPVGDPHASEYMPDHYTALTYFSGFHGENSNFVVTMTESAVWADEMCIRDSDVRRGIVDPQKDDKKDKGDDNDEQ